ncbi:MAG TPA: histidine phosphatase family protein [Anaerolineaceae bacterium]|nr:histidine phosphatase family protein [Anaerolineaceae bacterium]
MAKTLLLMRHAKSSWHDKDLPDYQRPLKKRGAEDAAEIAEVLRENELVPQIILSSPALRASQTAEIVAKVCNLEQKINYVNSFYMGEVREFVEQLQQLDDGLERVMIIAHNPGLEAFMQLLDGKIEALPTAALAYISLDLHKWSDITKDSTGELIGYWDPENLDKQAQESEMGKNKKDKKDKKEKKEKKEKKDKK